MFAPAATHAAFPRLKLANFSILHARFIHSPANITVALIIAFFVLRSTLALSLGLGVDESYSLANAHDLSLSYFDHPPLHLWIAHISEALFGPGRLARLPFVAMFAGTTWMMFRFADRLFGPAAGAWAALTLNLAGFFTFAAGEWILPDGPLMLCLSGAACSMAALLKPDPSRPTDTWSDWLKLGLWLGAAGLAKYQAAGFVVGLGLFFATTPSRWKLLRHPGAYAAFFLALIIVTPVMIWNAENSWVSFLFQAARGAQGHIWKPLHVASMVGGQILYLLPWIFVPLTWAAIHALRSGRASEARWLCLCLGLPLIALVTFAPLFGPAGLPHWGMAGWLMMFPLLGEMLANKAIDHVWPLRWAQVSAALLVVACALLVSQAATGWVKSLAPALFVKGDPSVESLAWDDLGAAFRKRGLLKAASFVVAVRWNEAGKVELALDHALPVLVFTQDPRNYAFRNDPAAFLGRDAVIVGKATTVQENIDLLKPYFADLIPIEPVTIERNGRSEIELRILYARQLLKPYPLPYPAR
jgi:hypothetical protein